MIYVSFKRRLTIRMMAPSSVSLHASTELLNFDIAIRQSENSSGIEWFPKTAPSIGSCVSLMNSIGIHASLILGVTKNYKLVGWVELREALHVCAINVGLRL